MKGLIYKDIAIFFKGIDKKTALIAVGATVLLMVKTGVYAGLLASVMFALFIAIQDLNGFMSDERACWGKYQMALPVSAVSVVAGKYISVAGTLIFSLAGSILFNLIASLVHRGFSGAVWGASAAIAVIVPLLWTGIGLPLSYWFGFPSAQAMGLFAVFPMFYFVKYFEDGAGFSAMADSVLSFAVLAGAAAAALFVISMGISMAGYSRRK